MDAKDIKTGFALPWTQGALLAALLGFGALFMQDAPYESARQSGEAWSDDAHFGDQDLAARLWQDPIGSVQRERDKAKPGSPEPRRAEALGRRIAQAAQAAPAPNGVAVLAVLLRGGPHVESVEHRRRTRYAVLAAAGAMALAPEDSDHLGWVSKPAADLPDAVPYEWLRLTPDRDDGKRRPRRLLVLWLDDRAFAEQPVARMAALKAALDPGGVTGIWRVLGPARSDHLQAMLAEPAVPAASAAGLRYYDASATVSERALLKDAPAGEVKDGCAVGAALQRRHGLGFTRTIASDDRVVDALVDELELRGLRPVKLLAPDGKEDDARDRLCRGAGAGSADAPSHVAIVAEWDTLYGRALRRLFRADTQNAGYCVEPFKYLRGLDGMLPADKPAGDDGKARAAKGDERRKDGGLIERAEGMSQFDYLRRLAQQIKARDAELRLKTHDGKGLRAIGVMGSDLHDKLLVLQALAPELPDAMFFTTDLDARYLHPREQAWSRNLVIGSSFGLRLEDGLQSGTPAFRDSYQTATFFATRLLLDDVRRNAGHGPQGACGREDDAGWSQARLMEWLERPRVFEVGRTAAFDFSSREGVRTECRGIDALAECADIHPPGSAPAPRPGLAARWVGCCVLLLAWVPVALTWLRNPRLLLRWLGFPSPAGRRLRGGRLLAWGLLQFVVAPLALAWAWPHLATLMTQGGKPLVWAEGISTWPTEFIRLAVVAIGAYMLLRGWRGLQLSQRHLTRRFRLGLARHRMEERQADAEKKLTLGERIVNIFAWGAMRPPIRHDAASGLPLDAERLWQRHVVQNRTSARVWRTGACVVLALLLTGALVLAFHDLQTVPQRGPLSKAVHDVVLGLVFVVLYAVVFFVVDATVLCVSFLRELRRDTTAWPAATIGRYEEHLGFRDRDLVGHWIDLEFLGRRTHAVNQLIYHPFILLSLVLLSRSPAFDDWTMPLVGKVLAALGALLALACPVMLRLTAEKSRRTALYHVDAALTRAHGSADKAPPAVGLGPPSAKQIELLRSHIAGLDRGALAPYTQQPLLKAVLLPFATLGGSQLLEYLRLASL